MPGLARCANKDKLSPTWTSPQISAVYMSFVNAERPTKNALELDNAPPLPRSKVLGKEKNETEIGPLTRY